MTYLQLFDPVCSGAKGVKLLKDLIQQLRRMAYADGLDIVTLFAYTDDQLSSLPMCFPEKVLGKHNAALNFHLDSAKPTGTPPQSNSVFISRSYIIKTLPLKVVSILIGCPAPPLRGGSDIVLVGFACRLETGASIILMGQP